MASKATTKTTTVVKSESQKVALSPPWQIFYREVQSLFGRDREIKIFYDEPSQEIKLFVNNDKMADALTKLLPTEKLFGNVVISIKVISSNRKCRSYDDESIFDTAFRYNPVYCYSKTYADVFTNPITYVVFKREVVQYYSDNLCDINGICSTLYQNIAQDVMPVDGVYYCTNSACEPIERAVDASRPTTATII